MQLVLKNSKKPGISIVEILVAIFIVAVALGGVLTAASFSLKLSSLTAQTTQAGFLAEEAIEAVRSFRDGTQWAVNGLGTLSLDTAYHPEKTLDSPPSWNLIVGEETSGVFSRKIVLSRVLRDGSDNIVETGTEDSGTRKVTATVSWQGKQIEIITYIADWKK
ncbi:MAG: hypothetical protein ABIF89_01000 [bacterium]